MYPSPASTQIVGIDHIAFVVIYIYIHMYIHKICVHIFSVCVHMYIHIYTLKPGFDGALAKRDLAFPLGIRGRP